MFPYNPWARNDCLLSPTHSILQMTPRNAYASLALAPLVLALLAQPLSADKFYFGSEADKKKTQGNAANDDFVQGVLLKEDKDTYTIRILGGEINVAKSMVYKVERDGLTVAQLEAREAARTDALAQANTNRRQLQAAEAAATRDARAAEAAFRQTREPAELNIDVDFQGIIGHFPTGGRAIKPFDAIISRANLNGLVGLVDVHMRRRLDEQLGFRGRGRGRPPRSLPVQINFSGFLPPVRFRTYAPRNVTQRDLDFLQGQLYSLVEREVMLSASQNPATNTMNLPYRRRLYQ